MKVIRKISEYILQGAFLLSMPFVFSCSEETGSILSEKENELNVSAGIAAEIYTRNTNEGPVTSGSYYLSYPLAADNSYTLAEVIFGTDLTNPQIGKVATQDGEPYKWGLIGGSTPTFYLDNVPPSNVASTEPGEVIFDEYNTFKAGLYDSISFKNDLLWGNFTVQRNTTGTLHFDLHHYMSRVRVIVTADNTYEIDGNLNLEGALVEISNINLNPVSYNRFDGTLTLGDSYPQDFGAITLVDEQNPASQDYIPWSSSYTNDEGYQTFVSHSCVVPPQTLLEDNNRPRLTITLQNGSKFSGVLPHAMEIDPPAASGTTNPYPVTLSFLKEHILTIRTVISENPPQLAFMPVQVLEWVDKDTYDLVGHQAGIYTPQEFTKLIEYYTEQNEYQLQRYGPLITTDTGQMMWNFNFFSTLVIQVSDINELYGKMNPNLPGNYNYQFQNNGYTIYIRIGSQTPQIVSMQQLHNIMAGTSLSPFS